MHEAAGTQTHLSTHLKSLSFNLPQALSESAVRRREMINVMGPEWIIFNHSGPFLREKVVSDERES